ncbi:serine hydrolase [Tellurirhabdus rosea]|uniref:serine hydrolase n=1 Tax=Tellurirhabdus rosea TaxID=2674997 RepID=UPI0022541DC4|nr:serine hydrolase [Tellurirhabdus rosea]
MRRIAAFCLFLFSFNGFAQNTFISDSLDAYITREMQRQGVPGVAVAVVKDGKVVVLKGYGVRDITRPQEKVDENTLFQIASNTKAFTGTALALLESQKRLSLDDKVTQYLKDFKLLNPLAAGEASIRDMLSHRSGFETFQGDFLNWNSNLSRRDIIARMGRLQPTYSLRAKYGYCNSCFLTAGEVIPVVTDTSWDAYLQTHFFRPLQMTRTSTTTAALRAESNRYRPHTLSDGKLVAIEYANTDNIGPAGSINSSVKDLANWVLMQLDSGRFAGRRVVPFSVIQKTRSSNTVVGDIQSRLFPSSHFQTYGLGWFMNDYNGKKLIHHSGGSNGCVTNTYLVPELNLGVVVLTNTDHNSLYEMLCRQVIDAYMGLPYRNYSQIAWQSGRASEEKALAELREKRAQARRSSGPTLPLKAFTGAFRNDFYGNLTIREEKGRLNMYLTHHPQVVGRLEHLKDNTFLCTYSDPVMGVKELPFEVTGNEVKAITVSVNDFIDFKTYRFARVP